MSEINQEIMYWEVQRDGIITRNNDLKQVIKAKIAQLERTKDDINQIRKDMNRNERQILVCDEHIMQLGGEYDI